LRLATCDWMYRICSSRASTSIKMFAMTRFLGGSTTRHRAFAKGYPFRTDASRVSHLYCVLNMV
jgi:hypothetical protein